MTKKHIFIWQSGEPLQIDHDSHNPMRAISLSEYLYSKKFKVTLISSNYNHTYKKFRFKNIKKFKILKLKPNFNLVLINSCGYKKNISFQRLVDHFLLSLNLYFFLRKNNEKIDFAILGFPPIEPSIVFSNWLKKKKIPYIFDIKDLWPEYFYERIKNRIISFIIKILFIPHDIFLKRSLKKSIGITANNIFFLKYILKKIKRQKSPNDKVIYLTKPILNHKSLAFLKQINFNKKNFNIYFCGRVNLEVFDFETVFKALKTLKTDKVNFHFYIGGYGEIDELKKLIDKYKLNEKVTTLGFVNKYKHSNLLRKTDIFIAPFFNNLNFSSNLSNKFIESIQYNLPILTPLKKDVSRFILKNKIGDIYKEKNYKDLVKKIKIMIISLNKNNSTKKNLNRLSNNDFDHHNNYSKFLSIINNFK
jgi:hypothetical protein